MTLYLADTSIWIARAIPEHDDHGRTGEWLNSVGGSDRVVVCRAIQQSLLRLLTLAALTRGYGYPPMSNADAWTRYDSLIADDRVIFRSDEPDGLEARWRQLTERDTASPKLWMDAYLAAFAIEGGYRMVTTDAAFRQFPGLDLVVLGQPA